jgi:hypothetical protein
LHKSRGTLEGLGIACVQADTRRKCTLFEPLKNI